MGFLTRPRLLVCLLLAVVIAAHAREAEPQGATAGERRVAERLNRIRQEPPALRAFLQAMPKGADLHVHLTGAVYAESYIRWAAEMPLCVDVSTFAYDTCNNPAGQRPAAQVLQDPQLYRRVIDALSIRNWSAARAAGHDQFFDSFAKFSAVIGNGRGPSADIVARAIAEVRQRAARQAVQHLEIIMSVGSQGEVPSAGLSWDTDEHFPELRERVLANGFRQRLEERKRWFDDIDAQVHASLGCGTSSAMPGCDVSVRFIASASRGVPPEQMFAQAMFAFELAAADPRFVGVNLVAPEDSYIAMRDYDLHMRMFRFFRQSYPGVHVSLHAGELSFGLVPPEQLGLHVRRAVEIAGAERIGHGTDVMYDANPASVLRTMVQRRIAVEISLTSSDVILGVRGPSHPMRHYLRAGVPVVIATDDEGVARSDLTNEYQRAVVEQGLSYRELKQMSRNALEYSFLPASEKACLRQRLDAAFVRFEGRETVRSEARRAQHRTGTTGTIAH